MPIIMIEILSFCNSMTITIMEQSISAILTYYFEAIIHISISFFFPYSITLYKPYIHIAADVYTNYVSYSGNH